MKADDLQGRGLCSTRSPVEFGNEHFRGGAKAGLGRFGRVYGREGGFTSVVYTKDD